MGGVRSHTHTDSRIIYNRYIFQRTVTHSIFFRLTRFFFYSFKTFQLFFVVVVLFVVVCVIVVFVIFFVALVFVVRVCICFCCHRLCCPCLCQKFCVWYCQQIMCKNLICLMHLSLRLKTGCWRSSFQTKQTNLFQGLTIVYINLNI